MAVLRLPGDTFQKPKKQLPQSPGLLSQAPSPALDRAQPASRPQRPWFCAQCWVPVPPTQWLGAGEKQRAFPSDRLP